MEKTKLLSILKRSYQPQYKNKSPFECLNLLKTEVPFTIYADRMDAVDMALFSFILPQTELESDLSNLYDEIKFNLFAYSYFEIINEDVYVGCNSCGGDGDVTCNSCGGDGDVDCSECSGDGSSECDYCDGTGETEDGDRCSDCGGDGYKECKFCDGSGNEECSECEGRGSENCDECDGSGDVEDKDLRKIYQYMFVCYNQKIKDSLLYKEEFEILSDDTVNILMNNKKTLLINVKKSNTEVLWDDGDADDKLFVSVSEEPTLFKSGNGIDVREIPDIG
jgi:hypothetical protein